MSLVEVPWLLRQTRTHARDPRWRTASVFADGDETVPSVHRSQVTRWERGEIAATYPVVRRYERLCGLDEGRLASAIDLVHRYDQPIAAAPKLRRPAPADRAAEADALLSRALDGDPLTGLEWDRLSALLGDLPEAFLMRRDWQDLVRRGLREMDVTVGLAYTQRAEAMGRVAGHPRAGRHVTDLARSILADPDAQVYSEAAALLQHCSDPAVFEVLRDVVLDPVGPNALRAALFAAATIVRTRRTTGSAAVDLVRLALDLARDADRPYRVRRSAADVLLALRPATRRTIAHELRRRPEDLSVASIVAGDGPRPRGELRALRTRIVRRLEEQGVALHDEPALLQLVGYITVETNDELRGNALQLLMLLPFGAPVGHAYVAELADAVGRRDPLGLHESLGVLLALTPQGDTALLTDLAVRAVDVPGDADHVAVEACWAVGNAKFASAPSSEPSRRVATALREAWAARERVRPELYQAWAYLVGMRGPRSLLTELVAPDDVPGADAWEEARRWWLAVPEHLSRPLEAR